MDHLWDEFSKSLEEAVPRRESLRRLGALVAGAVLGPLGLGTAWAGTTDPCKAFCRCRGKRQAQCLAVCRSCNHNTDRIGGSCGRYVCCSIAACHGVCTNLTSDPNCGACGNNCGAFGQTCCAGLCADLARDVTNCGACGVVCASPPAGEVVSCVSGRCVYDCAPGAVNCNGKCAFVETDPNNCGACGNVCPANAPFCSGGTCSSCAPGLSLCSGVCTDLTFDNSNCGACGVVCPDFYSCQGTCQPIG